MALMGGGNGTGSRVRRGKPPGRGLGLAQQPTFHLDRLEMPGAPDDGIVLFRPVTQQKHHLLLRSSGWATRSTPSGRATSSPTARWRGPRCGPRRNAITSQFTIVRSAGFELFDRSRSASHSRHLGSGRATTSNRSQLGLPAAAQPHRVRHQRSGASATCGSTSATSSCASEERHRRPRRAAEHVRAHRAGLEHQLRRRRRDRRVHADGHGRVDALQEHSRSPSSPTRASSSATRTPSTTPRGKSGPPDGLGHRHEWRWAVGAYLPLAGGKYRLGADIFGQTGHDQRQHRRQHRLHHAEHAHRVERRGADAAAHRRLRPLVRRRGRGLAHRHGLRRAGPAHRGPRSARTSPSRTPNADSPEARAKVRGTPSASRSRTPTATASPTTSTPAPPSPRTTRTPTRATAARRPADRDGDGIPDQYDKCPDQPEDKDGIDDDDGCPEDDADNDGIPDAKDACPKEPGQPDPDPKKNGCPKFIHLEGSSVRVLQQVHFATGSATILPDSFPMLNEIVQLLQGHARASRRCGSRATPTTAAPRR